MTAPSRAHVFCSSFQFLSTLYPAVSPFPFRLVEYVQNAVSEEPRNPGVGKKFLLKVSSFSSCCPRLSSLWLLPRSGQAAGTPSAVASCSFGPLPNSAFSCSSFRASPYERSSLTFPIFEVTGMERLEIGAFFFFVFFFLISCSFIATETLYLL